MTEELTNYIQWCINLRTVIIRELSDSQISTNDLAELLNVNSNSIRARKRNPQAWSFNDLTILANHLGLPDAPFLQIRTLADRLHNLPSEDLEKLLKASNLNRHKFRLRQKKHQVWKPGDLDLLALGLRVLDIKNNLF